MNLIVIQWQWQRQRQGLSNVVCRNAVTRCRHCAYEFDRNRKFIMRSELTILSASNFKTTTTNTVPMNEAIVNNRRNFCVFLFMNGCTTRISTFHRMQLINSVDMKCVKRTITLLFILVIFPLYTLSIVPIHGYN